jgi:hypothetical protein
MPFSRQTSFTARPFSTSLRILTICVSVNRVFFILEFSFLGAYYAEKIHLLVALFYRMFTQQWRGSIDEKQRGVAAFSLISYHFRCTLLVHELNSSQTTKPITKHF